jgi:hypothetical protein
MVAVLTATPAAEEVDDMTTVAVAKTVDVDVLEEVE